MMSVAQVAALAGCTGQTVRNNHAFLKPKRGGLGRWLYDPAIVAEWIASRPPVPPKQERAPRNAMIPRRRKVAPTRKVLPSKLSRFARAALARTAAARAAETPIDLEPDPELDALPAVVVSARRNVSPESIVESESIVEFDGAELAMEFEP